MIGNLLSRGVGMVLTPLYTGVLLTQELNYWESLLLGANLLSMLAANSTTAAMMWTLKTGGAGGKGPLSGDDEQRVISGTVGWTVLMALVVCGGAALFAEPLSGAVLNTGGYALPLALLLLAQGLRVVTWPAEGVLKLRFQSLPIVYMNFGEFAVQLVGSLVLLVGFDMRLHGLAWAAFAATLLRFGLGLWFLPEMRRPRIDFSLVGGLLRYGVPLMPGAVAALVISLSDRLFFNAYGMADAGGVYVYGDKFARLVEMVLIAPLVAMWPAVYFNIARDADADRQFGRIATLWLGLGGCFAFALTMCGLPIAALFDTSEGGDFTGGAATIGVLTAGYVLLGFVEIGRAGFSITGRTKRTAACMVMAALVNLGLNVVLIPRMGAMGAAWSTLAAYATALLLVHVLNAKVMPQRWQWGRLAGSGGLLVGAAWAIDAWAPAANDPAGMVLRAVAAVLAPFVLLATGFLTADERKAGLATIGKLLARVRGRSA